jgi:cell shape-determining protein MreD
MSVLTRQRWTPITALAVPLLVLAAPAPLFLAGMPPSWAVLWLLPWALVDGAFSGAVAGLGLGLILDGLHAGPISEIPALTLLGWWWGRLGRKAPPIERSFNLGLLALLGAALQGVLIWVQQLWWGADNVAALHMLLAQALLTGLLAPLLCSLQLLFWRQLAPGLRT